MCRARALLLGPWFQPKALSQQETTKPKQPEESSSTQLPAEKLPLVYLVPQKTLKNKQAAHTSGRSFPGQQKCQSWKHIQAQRQRLSEYKGLARGPRNWLEEEWTPEKKTPEKKTSGRQYLPWLKVYLICFSVGTVFGEPLSSAQWGPVCGQAGPETFSQARWFNA